MVIADAAGLPVAVHVESASPHEVRLVEDAIDSSFTENAPDKLVGDKAYDSDKLDEQLLEERGVEMIARPIVKGANNQYPRRQEAEALSTQMEGGAPVCLASKFQAVDCSLRIPCR